MSDLRVDDVTLKLAAKSGVEPKAVRAVLQAQAELAYENALTGYPIAGIGIFHLYSTQAREMVMPFGPDKGKTKLFPARKRLQVRIAMAAKNVVLGGAATPLDVTALPLGLSDEPVDD